jgi:hypothetical protein
MLWTFSRTWDNAGKVRLAEMMVMQPQLSDQWRTRYWFNELIVSPGFGVSHGRNLKSLLA